ncbi:hypothetical protein ACFL1N_04130 [Thermodesulfobacteriota bacterium]
MNMTGIWISAVMILVVLLFACQPFNSDQGTQGVTLNLLNPRGEITLPPVSAPSKRISDLKGKTVGLYWNEKPGGNHFWNGIETLMKEKLPDTDIIRYSGAFDLGDELAARMAKETDAFLYGVGD